jgi:hypothetical protein
VTLEEHQQAPAPASVALSAALVALSKHITMLLYQSNCKHMADPRIYSKR